MKLSRELKAFWKILPMYAIAGATFMFLYIDYCVKR